MYKEKKDEVVLMNKGRNTLIVLVLLQTTTQQILNSPNHDYLFLLLW